MVKDCDLQWNVNKTEVVILTTKRGYVMPRLQLEVSPLELKKEIRYLGVILSKTLGYKRHLEVAAIKESVTKMAFSRLIPNTNDPKP